MANNRAAQDSIGVPQGGRMIYMKVTGENSLDAVQIVTGLLEVFEVPLEVVLKTRVHENAGMTTANQVDGFNPVGAVDLGQGVPDLAAQAKPVSQVRSDSFGIGHVERRSPRRLLFLSGEN